MKVVRSTAIAFALLFIPPFYASAAGAEHKITSSPAAAIAPEPICSAVESRLPLCDADLTAASNQSALEKLSVPPDKALNIHRALALSPGLFDGFAAMAVAIKHVRDLGQRDIELVILQTAMLKHGQYQLAQHKILARRAGFSDAELDALGSWRTSRLFDDRQRALLDFVEQSLWQTGVTDQGYKNAHTYFSAKQLVEIVMISGFAAASCQLTNAFSVPVDK